MTNSEHPARPASRRWWKHLAVSSVFHAAAVLFLVALVPLHHFAKISNGSPAAALTLSLAQSPPTFIPITRQPLPAPAKQEEKPSVVARPLTPTVMESKTPSPMPIKEGVPVLARVTPLKPARARPAPSRTALTHIVTHSRPASSHAFAPAAPVASSFAPGENVFPHPPYPDEARDRREIGTVKVNVRFDPQGRVAAITILQSSGSLILDHYTATFVRSNWHSTAEAGRTVSVPVQYLLENL